MTTKMKKNKLMMFGLGLLAAGLMLFNPIIAYANPSFNPPPAISQPAPEQQRFEWAYWFESYVDFRFDLGRPTTFNGVVPHDVMTANIRRDANVSLQPPGPRIGNTITPTDPSNWAFWAFVWQYNQLHHNGFWFPVEHLNTNVISHFDTMQHGVNANSHGNQTGMQTNVQTSGANQGGGGFLPPTSI